jgi:hypothetical protein
MLSTRVRVKRLLTDDQKRWLKNNSRILPVEQLASVLGITVDQAKGQCDKIYCGYFSRKGAA